MLALSTRGLRRPGGFSRPMCWVLEGPYPRAWESLEIAVSSPSCCQPSWLQRGCPKGSRSRLTVTNSLWVLVSLVGAAVGVGRELPQRHGPPHAIIVPRLEKPPQIDGHLSPREWEGALALELNYQVQPGDNVPPTERTEVFLAYDRDRFYVAFHAYDREPSAVRAHVSRRDDVYTDDYVTLFLDTYGDRRRAYRFDFNPLGIQADGIYTEGLTAQRNVGQVTTTTPDVIYTGGTGTASDLTWDGILLSKGSLTSDGYVVEVAIPFKTIRFQVGRHPWGLHLQRWIARRVERISWQPLSRDVAGLLIQMGTITGFDDIYEGRTLDLTPTLTGAQTAERRSDRQMVTHYRLEPGLTVRWALSPNLVLSLAGNPDFSQVESDVPQIEVNQRFPLFFPEKRPFFLEGAEIFRPAQVSASALRVVDTRQIVDPDWGLKLTGKVGKNSLGLLLASDRAPGLQGPADDPRRGKNALFTIFRYQRDILADSTVGGFLTDWRFAQAANTVGAADGRLRLGDGSTFAFQLIGSRTASPTAPDRRGGAHLLRFAHDGEHWKIALVERRVGREYRALAGFTRRTGFRNNFARLGYEFRPREANRWYVSIQPYVQGQYLRTSEGMIDESYFDQGLDIVFPRGIALSLWHSFDEESLGQRVVSYHFANVGVEIENWKQLTLAAAVQFGEGPHFNPAHFVVGRRLNIDFRLTLKPLRALTSEFLYLKSRLTDRVIPRVLFNQDTIRNRTLLQITRNHALRSILEYDSFERRLDISELYSFTPSPGTAFYVGYSDALSARGDLMRGTRVPGLDRLRRVIFVKFSYNFRL